MSNELSRLLQLTEEKEKEVLIILEKTLEQQTQLLNDNIEALNEITELKQEKIDIIDQIDIYFKNEYHSFFSNGKFEHHLLGVEKDIFDEMQAKIANITATIKQIDVLSNQNEAYLIKKMKELKQNIRQVNNGKKGFNAYFQKDVSSSIYIDHKN